MAQPNLPAPIDQPEYDIPEMRELSTMQQRFVIARNDGSKNATQALRAAGWEGTEGGCQLMAHRWMHNPKVQAALRAMNPGRLHDLGPIAWKRLNEILDDPQRKGHDKMLKWTLEKLMPTIQQHFVQHAGTVDHKLTLDDAKKEISRIFKENPEFTPPAGFLIPKVVEAEFEEVPDLSDLEDVL